MPSAAVVAQSSSSSMLSSSPVAAAAGAIIATPTPVDILCGKDRECHDFVGSQRYRWLIETYRHKYANAGTRLEKMAVTMEIYSLLQRTNSRFLRYNEDMAGWEEVPFLAARDKIGHALRFANRTTRRRDKKANTNSSSSNNSQDTKVVEQYQPQQQEYASNPYNALQDQITAAVMNVQSPFAALSSASGPTNSSMSKQQQTLERSLIYAPPSAVTVSFLQQKQKEAADRNAPTVECSWQHHGMNMNTIVNMGPTSSKNPNSFSVFPSPDADHVQQGHNEVTNMPPPPQLVPSRVPANVERIRSATAASGNSSGPEPLWLNTKGPAGGRSPKNLAFAAALKLVQAAQQDHQAQAALTRAPQDMQQQQQQAPQNVSSWNATPQQHRSPQLTPSEDMRHSSNKNQNQVINNNIHVCMSLEQPSVQGAMGELGEVRSRIETQHRRGTTTTVESQTDAILQDSRLAFTTSLNHKSTEVTPSATLWHYSKTSPKQDENQNKKSCSCHHAYPPLPFIILAPDENPNLEDDYNPFHFFAVQENANPGPCCCHEDHPTESSSSSDDDNDSMTGSEHWSIVRDFVDDLDLDLEASISY